MSSLNSSVCSSHLVFQTADFLPMLEWKYSRCGGRLHWVIHPYKDDVEVIQLIMCLHERQNWKWEGVGGLGLSFSLSMSLHVVIGRSFLLVRKFPQRGRMTAIDSLLFTEWRFTSWAESSRCFFPGARLSVRTLGLGLCSSEKKKLSKSPLPSQHFHS